jgi:hypothetical protein
MAATYVIFLPPFTNKSAGIQSLWRLSETIERISKSVVRIICTIHNGKFLISFNGSEWIPCNENTIREAVSPLYQPVIIHSEILDCRYFRGLNVARYYLNKMGVLVNKGSAAEGEFKIAFDPSFCENYDFLLTQYTGKVPLLYARKMAIDPRRMDLTYIGKGHLYSKETPILAGSVCLTREWPATTDEYLTLLTNSRYLYSYDTITSVIVDAALMGVVPFLMTWAPFGENELKKMMEHSAPCYIFDRENINNFDFQVFLDQRNVFIDRMLTHEWATDLVPSVSAMCIAIEEFFSLD